MRKVGLFLTFFLATFPVFAQNEMLYYVIGSQTVNVRRCPQTTCSVVTTLNPGSSIQVLETVEGAAVQGNARWYRIHIKGVEAFIHSSLVSRTPPQSAQTQDSFSSSTAFQIIMVFAVIGGVMVVLALIKGAIIDDPPIVRRPSEESMVIPRQPPKPTPDLSAGYDSTDYRGDIPYRMSKDGKTKIVGW